MIYYSLTRHLLILRESMKISQVEMARRLNRSQGWVSKLENNMKPDIHDLEAYAKALGYEIDYHLKRVQDATN